MAQDTSPAQDDQELQINLSAPSPYRTAIDIENDALEMFEQWTGCKVQSNTLNPKAQMREFQIDLGMAILGYAHLCKWTIRTRKLNYQGTTHVIYEVRGFDPPQPVPMFRQNCSEEMANFLHGRLIRTLDFLRNCSKFVGIPHVHVVSIRNHYVLSAIWKPYQNKIWMIPVDQVENLSFSVHIL
ncbi:MAG: hypothetical protein ACK4QL_03610 [Pseudanabaenaceae cyanobacterium]